MLENAVLGIIQGIAEWLPISSEGLLVLVRTHLLGHPNGFSSIIQHVLLLHFGTFLSALIYFRKDVLHLIKCLCVYKSQTEESQNLLVFLLVSTLISGFLGIILISFVTQMVSRFETTGQFITTMIGVFLLLTGFVEMKAYRGDKKEIKDLKMIHGIVLGFVQGFAVLPGLSRSGLTVSALLLGRFDKSAALKLSFLMSLPIVLGGNLVLYPNLLNWSWDMAIGVFFSFLFGLLTIHLLLRIAQKINFGYFMVFFGSITLLFAFI